MFQVPKIVNIPVSEYFSFAKRIQPPDRCDISRSQWRLLRGISACNKSHFVGENSLAGPGSQVGGPGYQKHEPGPLTWKTGPDNEFSPTMAALLPSHVKSID